MIMGIVGYLMIRFDYPRLTLVIALVLGETCERSYHQTRMISDGDILGFMAVRPQALILIGLIVLTLALPSLRRVKWRAR
jgi:putative tricarboxylic transport membrane protein